MAGEETTVATPGTVVDEAGIQRTPTGELAPGTAKTVAETKVEGAEGGEKKDAAKVETKSGAPEKYGDFTLPEGYEFQPETLTEVSGLFKEMGLTQEQGQKLVDFYAKRSVEAYDKPFQQYQDTRAEWVKEAEAHPDLKGKLTGEASPVKVTIAKMFDGFGDAKLTQDFKDAMNLTGAGDHPAFIRVMYKLAQMVTEGQHVSGGGPSKDGQRAPGTSDRPSAARAMYPNLPG